MLNILWCPSAVGADVEANILTDSALVGAEESTMSGSNLGEGLCIPSGLIPFQKCGLLGNDHLTLHLFLD